MPCTLYSGIKPPAALLEEMSRRQDLSEPAIKTAASVGQATGSTQQLPPFGRVPQPLGMRPQGVGNPAVPSPQYAPPPAGESDEPPPPSYEDAMADDLGPVDGPRRHYEQPQSEPVVGDQKMGSLFGS